MVLKKILIGIIILISLGLEGCPVKILIVDNKGNSLANITIKVLKNTVFTNASGNATIDIEDGNYLVELFSGSDFLLKTQIKADCNSNEIITLIIPQNLNVKDIETVNMAVSTPQKNIEKSPFSVQGIDVSQDYNKSGDIGEVLNRATGVKLRSEGNIGGNVQINLGGLQGKAVRLFRDGIPMELFGHGFSLGTIPANMLERVEIYKGALPLSLASDALGGAINLVSRSEHKNALEVSYEIASFNTHRVTLNGFWQSANRMWYAGTSSSFNYSDNNYKVNAPFIDSETSTVQYRNAKRFHDAVRAHYAEVFFGIKNRTWTDDLRFTFINSSFYKEIQNDAEMNKVYGEPYSMEYNYTSLLNYKKAFFNQKLKINFLGSYSYFNTKFIDTSTSVYDWDGNIIATGQTPGEINLGNNQRLDFHFLSVRVNASYQISGNHFLDFNELYYQQRRTGSDPLGAISAIENIDVLTVPSIYRKNIMGLGLRSKWFQNHVESVVAVKHFSYNTQGYTTDNFGLGWISSSNDQQLGYMGGLRWSKNKYLVKMSYEFANRLPDEYEIFGDARLVKENMDLKPEKSHNVNLNEEFNAGKEQHNFIVSAGLFYRKVRDIIFLQLDIPFNRYINYEKAEVKGAEIEFNYIPNKHWNTGFNLTYQDIRRVDISETMFRNLEGSRIPNVPFLFGNFWLNTSFKGIFSAKDRIELNWNANYTHRFFLHAVPRNQEPSLFGDVDAFQTSLIIPKDNRWGQFSNNVGVYYHFASEKFSVAAECKNIGNVRLYDNFNVQKPGRSFHIKFVYQIF